MSYLVTCLMMESARAPTTRWWDNSPGILCRMVKAGKLKHLDSCRPKLSVQVCGVSRDTVRVNTALLTDEGVVSTVFCGKCASTLCLEEQERHRRLEPGVSTRQNLVNRTGGDHGPVRESRGKEPCRQHACHRSRHGPGSSKQRARSYPRKAQGASHPAP